MLPYAGWLSWLIPTVGSLFVPLFFKLGKKIGEWYSVAVVAVAAVFSVSMIPEAWGYGRQVIKIPWIPLGGGKWIEASILIDPLSVLMASIATGIGTLIVLYSIGYMAHEEGLPRYYFFILFFIGGMTGLVMAENLLQLYIFWEIVGLCSYALIGFYYRKKEATHAGIKAFVTTRVGDVMMLLGILLLFISFGTFSYSGLAEILHEGAAGGSLDMGMLTLSLLLIFGGAVGKSAQFPLHVWLPDAMEGPTPVSALIHAATMVKAGVYLVARMIFTVVPLEVFSPAMLSDWYLTIALIGGFTAFFAATMGLVTSDIKRVIAYSTISQLALMLTALGMASETGLFGGVFHLLSHSLFKALLFLAAGAVIHAVHTNNMDEMGGLKRHMPITFWTSLVGILALSGVPPLSGFWSKDIIITASLEAGHVVAYLFIIGASILTFIYSLRWLYKVFLAPPSPHVQNHHIHEAPPVMTIPLIILAASAAVIGFGEPLIADYMGIHPSKPPLLTYLSSAAILLIGGGIGYIFYIGGKVNPESVRLSPVGATLHKILLNRYYIDDFYYKAIVGGLDKLSAVIYKFIEVKIIDGFNYTLAKVATAFVQIFRNIQTGESNINISGFIIGIAILILLFLQFLLG
ncbi:MAG TPA: NADH-quinone oxidoreductase subunit L [Aigarchaeota archaeon]|nr:NADH-quinone oxidoreductase subunit L [Aigarchaeota archaeon]